MANRRKDPVGARRLWQKWLFLVLALLQGLIFRADLLEYRQVQAAGIMSPELWRTWSAGQRLGCALSALLAIGFLGIFLQGLLVKGERSGQLADGVLLLALAPAWFIAVPLLDALAGTWNRVLWLGCTALLLAGGLSCLRRYRKMNP